VKVRTLLIATAIVSSILGAVIAYLVLTVPNDLAANALLKQAHKDIAAGKTDKARESLSRVIQQYPRTDGAAAATVALMRLGVQERDRLARQLDAVRRQSDAQKQQLGELQAKVTELANAPPKVIVEKPAPQPAPKKKATPTRRRRR
jgi:hypothetical protein